MKKILKAFLLIFCVSISLLTILPKSYADEEGELKEYINAVSYMLEQNRDYFTIETIEKLEKWINKSTKILQRKKEEKSNAMNLVNGIKEEIGDNLRERKDFFKIYVNDYIKEEKIHDIFNQALRENRYFYYAIYKGANISTNYYQDTNDEGANFVESIDFSMKYRQSREDEERVEKFTNDWINKNIKNEMSDIEKIKLVHDFIVKENSYYVGDENSLSDGHSIYSPASILFGKGGVCNAYATLFGKVAEKAGITTYYSTGTIKENGQLHIWNMVKLENDWYNIDLTWDDPILNSADKILNEKDFVSYDYFLVSDEEISKTRTIDEDDKRPPSVKTFDHGFTTTKIRFEKRDDKISYIFPDKNNLFLMNYS